MYIGIVWQDKVLLGVVILSLRSTSQYGLNYGAANVERAELEIVQ